MSKALDENAAVAKVVDICCPVAIPDIFKRLDESQAPASSEIFLDHVVCGVVVDLVQHGCVPLSVNCG